jgi:GTPase SAR1 family protein
VKKTFLCFSTAIFDNFNFCSQKVNIIKVDIFILMLQQSNCVSCVLIGDTGVGKSEFGNRYLGKQVFNTSDSAYPVTLEPKCQSAVIDGSTRHVIDTEGYASGNRISSDQIQKLARFLRSWKYGTNAICVILNGQSDRFSQGVQDTLQWAYNTFATHEVLEHICIVFTRCYHGIKQPNRERKRTEYLKCIQDFLKKISGARAVPLIPIFFVDSLDPEDEETQQNMVQFHGWVSGRTPLSTNNVKVANIGHQIKEETKNKIFVEYVIRGPPADQYRFAVYQDKKRNIILPNNGDKESYTEWKVVKTWEEPAGHQTIKTIRIPHVNEVKEVEHHKKHSLGGLSSGPHTHYTIKRVMWDEEYTETTDFSGKVTKTPSRRIEKDSVVTCKDRERGYTEGYNRSIS